MTEKDIYKLRDCVNQEEFDRLEQEEESQIAAGYQGGYNLKPSMKNQPVKLSPRYTEEQIDIVLEALALSKNNPTDAAELLLKWKEGSEDDDIDIRIPPNIACLGSLRNRNMDRFWEIIGTTKATSALLEVMSNSRSPNAKLQAAIHALDRAYGKPTIRAEIITTHVTQEEVGELRRKQIEERIKDGLWSNPEGVGLNPEVSGEDEDGNVGL